jgi:transposase-like protein
VQVNIKNLIDDVQSYQTVRTLRWPEGITCPSCQGKRVIKCGFDDTEHARQRYECTDCPKRFDDLTDAIFAGHHQPLKVWILCLYFMGLNLSNEQIANELGVHRSDVHQMTTLLRGGTEKKSQACPAVACGPTKTVVARQETAGSQHHRGTRARLHAPSTITRQAAGP